MSPFSLALAALRDRWLASLLHTLLFALASAIAIALLLVGTQINRALERDLGSIDFVVGAKGSPLQLILASVFHIDEPTGNLPWSALATLSADPKVELAVPVGLGDSFRGYRLVGTDARFLDLYDASLAQGTMFGTGLEAVIGDEIASKLGVRIGDQIAASHGLGTGGDSHDEHFLTVTGIIKPTGSVLDRLILTPMEAVWSLHGGMGVVHDHDRAHELGLAHSHGADGAMQPASPGAAIDHKHQHDHAKGHANDHDHDAADPAGDPREVTAILVRARGALAAATLPARLNKSTAYVAAVPAKEAVRVLSLLGVGFDALRAVAILLVSVAALSVFAAMLSALRERRGDLALLRVMGATRNWLVTFVLLQGAIVAALGALIGFVGGHLLVALLGRLQGPGQHMRLQPWEILPGEGWILAGALAIGLLAALIPAILAYRQDVARTLAES